MTTLARSSVPPAQRRATPAVGGDDTEALLAEVNASLAALRRLFGHSRLLAPEEVAALRGTVEQVERRLAREELLVVIVGERGAGKTTFVDAIIGDRTLGAALANIHAVTYVRHRPAPTYRARFQSGAVEDFSRRVPDRKGEIAGRLAAGQDALARAEAAVAAATELTEQRNQAVLDAEQGRKQAFVELEAARDSAQRVRTELAVVEHSSAEIDKAIRELEQTIPEKLRDKPPWWAFWLWLMVAFFALFRRDVWRGYALRRRERDEVRGLLPPARQKAAEAFEAWTQWESRLGQFGSTLAELRALAADASSELARAEAERERLWREVEATAAELAEYGDARLRRFFVDLAALSDRRAHPEPLVELSVDYPTRFLPEHIAIMDVPGVMDDDPVQTERAWSVIREEADGCMLISELERGVSMHAKRFLQQVREVVPRVLLVLTKLDQAFAKAVERGGTDPWEQLEQARRIGTRRFAREIGREPDEVLSVTVSAEAALAHAGKSSSLTRRFETEVDKLFQLLRHERALILGARAAAAIRRCIAGMTESQERAERAYQERIGRLEATRLPEPEAFRQRQVAAAEASIGLSAERLITQAAGVVRDGFAMLRTYAHDQIGSAKDKQELLERAQALESQLADGVAKLRADALLGLDNGIDAAVRELETGIFEELRKQYQLVHQLRHEASSHPRLDLPTAREVTPVELSARIGQKLRSFGHQRIGLGLGGATAGAAVGTAILPGLGTAAGAAVGVLLGLVRTKTQLSRELLEIVDSALGAEQERVENELSARAPGIASNLRKELDRSVERSMQRFARYVEEPIEAERQAIERERALLADLQALELELERHDAKLGQLMRL